MTQRVPANIRRAKSMQKLKQKLSKRRYYTAENGNLSKSVAFITERFAGKHGVAQTVRLKLGSENNAQLEMVWPRANIALLDEDDSQMKHEGHNEHQALILRGTRWNI